MTSLFSSFDCFNYFAFGPYSSMIFFLLFSVGAFMYSKMKLMVSVPFLLLHDFFLTIQSKISKSVILILANFFFFFFFFNFFSVFPYYFSMTAHIFFILPLSLSLWLGVNIFQLLSSLNSFVIHMVPLGTPSYLVFFMVLVEFISNFIRPLTLCVRLMANVFSGHLLMILLFKLVNLYSSVGLVSFISYSFLSSVELLVSLIQSYIFCTLVYLYYTDIF